MKRIFIITIFLLCGFGYTQLKAQFPWVEGFESTTFPPTGWSILHTAGTKTWERYTTVPHSGTGSARHDFAIGQQTTALITPPIQLPNYGDVDLDFWSYIQLIGYQYSGVLVSTTVNNNLNAFTEIKKLSGSETEIGIWKHISVSLNAFLGETVYIAFLYDNNDGHRWTIDDITISHFASFVDMQALSVTPASAQYPLLGDEHIKVRLKNNSGTPATGFNLKLLHNGALVTTEIFTGSIPSLGEAEYTFNTPLNLSSVGTHTVQVVVEISGDQVPENNMATSTIVHLGCQPVTAFPYFEGFEDNGSNLPQCWTQEYLQPYWANSQNWRIMSTADANGIPGIEPKAPFDGTYRAVFSAIDYATRLISPPLNISTLGTPILKFHHIQKFYSGDTDSLKIYYKNSRFGEWTFLEKYTNMVNEWTERVIPLPNASNEYYIAFEAYGEYGYSVQLDNVIVGHFFNTDIAVKAITPEGEHIGLSDQQTVTTTIKNNGNNPVTGFSLSLFLDGDLVATEYFTGSIQGMDEAVYTFNAKVDLSISRYYTLTVTVHLTGDEVPENDELTVIVRNLNCDAITFPYDEGFENEIFPPNCWTNEGTEWERIPYSAHSGLGRARHKWWGNSSVQDGWLISPKFSIPTASECMLEFWSNVYYSNYYTYSGVWISTTNNNISSFVQVHELTYDERPEDTWVKIEIPLQSYTGQEIYIAFRYKNFGGDSGHAWSIDDINVFNLINYIDAEVMEISEPPSLAVNLTSAESVTVKIKNNGGDPISNFQLKLECNGTLLSTENYTGTIPSLAYRNYTFNKKLDLSAAGSYTIKVTVVLENDMVFANNSKSKIVENKVCPPIVNYTWQGAFQGNESGAIDDCWINIDADGDTQKWKSYENNGTFYAISASYDVTHEFPLTPDNWLLTPPLTLSQNCNLSFKVGAANSAQWGAEKYAVLVSSASINPVDFNAIHNELLNYTNFTELLDGELVGYGMKKVTLPLSAFVGKTVHIAFRHWDCTHQDRLLLSNIEVQTTNHINDLNGGASPLVVWIQDNIIYVGGLNMGEQISVYSVTGQLLYQSIVNSDMMSIPLKARGVYIVKSEIRVVKAVY